MKPVQIIGDVRTSEQKVRTISANKVRKFDLSEDVNEINGSETFSVWLTLKQCSHFEGTTVRALQKKIKRFPREKVRQVKGLGGTRFEVHIDCLSADAIRRYLELSGVKKQPTAMELAVRDAEFQANECIPNWKKDLACLRYGVIDEYRTFIAGVSRGELCDLKEQFCRMYNQGLLDIPQSVREKIKSISPATLGRWLKTLEDAKGDTFALAPQYGNNKGQTKISIEEEQLLMQCALVPLKPIKEAVSDFRKHMKLRGLEAKASDSTYQRAIGQFRRNNHDKWVFMREGAKAFNDKVVPPIVRNRDLVEVGDLLVADGHKLNFDILCPVTGKALRMILVLVYDFRTGMPLGWEISKTENTASISMAYYRAIKTLGFVPRRFYLDNGRAFKSHYFTRDGEKSITGLFDRLSIYGYEKTMFAKPYHGQSKPVEPFFRTLQQFSRRMTTYRGSGIEHKSPRLHRNEKRHQDHHEEITGGYVPEVIDVHRYLIEWISEYAMCKTSKQHGLKGQSPFDVYKASLDEVRSRPDYSSRCVNDDSLRFLMMEERRPLIRRNGITLLGKTYWHESLYGLKDIRPIVKYDTMDLSKVWVYDESGSNLLCVADRDPFGGVHPMAENDEDKNRLKGLLDMQRDLESRTVKEVKDIWKGQIESTSKALTTPPQKPAQQLKQAVGAETTGPDAGDVWIENSRRNRDARLLEEKRIYEENCKKYSIFK